MCVTHVYIAMSDNRSRSLPDTNCLQGSFHSKLFSSYSRPVDGSSMQLTIKTAKSTIVFIWDGMNSEL